MTITLDGTTGITTPTTSTTGEFVTSVTGFKNRIINGAMVIDQRNAGAALTPGSASSFYTVDRWQGNVSQASKLSFQQNAGSVTPPVGFVNYLGMTSQSAYTITTGDNFQIRQQIEANNIFDLGFGTANAKNTTLSFWVYSSLTGTFGGSLLNSSANYSYPFSYTISSANTWTQISITIAGPTGGSWSTGISTGVFVQFSLGAASSFLSTAGSWSSNTYLGVTGQTSVVGTNGATFYLTGVQLEKGSTATSFDYRPYSAELALCQRYYEKSYDIGTIASASTITGACKYVSPRTVNPSDDIFSVCYLASKRSSPTVTIYSTTGASGNIRNISSATDVASGGVTSGENSYSVRWSMTDGNFYGWQWISSSEL
jgi:hypothetical protein